MNRAMRCALILLVLAQSPMLMAEWFSREEPIMGTRVYVQLWHEDAAEAKQLMRRVMVEMERINQLMSPYKDHSELSRINQLAAKQPVAISAELYRLIEKANYYSEVSAGAFDITFASLGHRFNYREHRKPDEQSRIEATSLIDYRQLKLNQQASTIAFGKPGMRIDLGGIAKGYAVDNAIELLRRAGVTHAIVTAGGDSRLLGDHRGRPWMLGIKHPRGSESIITLPLDDSAISTSGDYERYFEEDGRRFHHIIDPAKGESASGVLSATILAKHSVDADALSTTVFILGPEKGLALVNSLAGISAILIDNNGKVFYSNDLVDPTMQ